MHTDEREFAPLIDLGWWQERPAERPDLYRRLRDAGRPGVRPDQSTRRAEGPRFLGGRHSRRRGRHQQAAGRVQLRAGHPDLRSDRRDAGVPRLHHRHGRSRNTCGCARSSRAASPRACSPSFAAWPKRPPPRSSTRCPHRANATSSPTSRPCCRCASSTTCSAFHASTNSSSCGRPTSCSVHRIPSTYPTRPPRASRRPSPRSSEKLIELLKRIAEDRIAHPPNDVISKLVTSDEENLTPQELAKFFILLIGAGNETTRNALTHGLHILSGHPDTARPPVAELRRHGGDRGGGDPALRQPGDPLSAHGHPRRRDADRLAVEVPTPSTQVTRSWSGIRRPTATPRSSPSRRFRHRAKTQQPRRFRRSRAAFLPRRPSGPARTQRGVPDAVRPLPRHRLGGRTGHAAVELRQRHQTSEGQLHTMNTQHDPVRADRRRHDHHAEPARSRQRGTTRRP